MGARPDHQDVFLELDYEIGRAPTRDGIAAMKAAFAAAPRPNPDGTTGIALHVDVGTLVDPTADEAHVPGTCSNGVDDDGDFAPDGADTSCTYLDTSREAGVPDCSTPPGLVPVDDDGDGLADGADPDCRVGGRFRRWTGASGAGGLRAGRGLLRDQGCELRSRGGSGSSITRCRALPMAPRAKVGRANSAATISSATTWTPER